MERERERAEEEARQREAAVAERGPRVEAGRTLGIGRSSGYVSVRSDSSRPYVAARGPEPGDPWMSPPQASSDGDRGMERSRARRFSGDRGGLMADMMAAMAGPSRAGTGRHMGGDAEVERIDGTLDLDDSSSDSGGSNMTGDELGDELARHLELRAGAEEEESSDGGSGRFPAGLSPRSGRALDEPAMGLLVPGVAGEGGFERAVRESGGGLPPRSSPGRQDAICGGEGGVQAAVEGDMPSWGALSAGVQGGMGAPQGWGNMEDVGEQQ